MAYNAPGLGKNNPDRLFLYFSDWNIYPVAWTTLEDKTIDTAVTERNSLHRPNMAAKTKDLHTRLIEFCAKVPNSKLYRPMYCPLSRRNRYLGHCRLIYASQDGLLTINVTMHGKAKLYTISQKKARRRKKNHKKKNKKKTGRSYHIRF